MSILSLTVIVIGAFVAVYIGLYNTNFKSLFKKEDTSIGSGNIVGLLSSVWSFP